MACSFRIAEVVNAKNAAASANVVTPFGVRGPLFKTLEDLNGVFERLRGAVDGAVETFRKFGGGLR